MNKSFFGFNQPSNIENKVVQLENKINNMKLMYRKPNSQEYQNITQVLDEVYNRLQIMEQRLSVIEDIHFDSSK